MNHTDPVQAHYRPTYVLEDGVEYDLVINYSGTWSFVQFFIFTILGLENPESLELWLRIEKQLNELADVMEGASILRPLLHLSVVHFNFIL